MKDLSLKLATVLGKLPIAVALVSSTGRFLGKAGGMAKLLGDMVPSHDAFEARRWSFLDARGAAIPRNLWPSARALRGECDYVGMVGIFRDGAQRAIKLISVPTPEDNTSEVAAVTFLQVFDTNDSSTDGWQLDMQQRLIDQLARAVASDWQNFKLAS